MSLLQRKKQRQQRLLLQNNLTRHILPMFVKGERKLALSFCAVLH